MPRPRTVDDDAILDAAMRVVERDGPAAVTLNRISAEVGLSAATLVQRFGTKRHLLLAATERGWASLLETFSQARRSHDSPLHALSAVLTSLTESVRTREAMANSIAFLHIDLSDPDFYRHAVAGARQMRTRIRALLDDAVDAGELVPTDTERLAAAVQTTYNGALITWAMSSKGRLETFLREQLDVLLDPHRPRR